MLTCILQAPTPEWCPLKYKPILPKDIFPSQFLLCPLANTWCLRKGMRQSVIPKRSSQIMFVWMVSLQPIYRLFLRMKSIRLSDIYTIQRFFSDIVRWNQIRKIDQLERVVKYTFNNVGNTFSAKSNSIFWSIHTSQSICLPYLELRLETQYENWTLCTLMLSICNKRIIVLILMLRICHWCLALRAV